MANYVAETTEKIVEELIEGSELELVDVEYIKEHDWYLRVYIDKPEGIDIEDCQLLSERLEARLDAEEVVPDSYILEVSSPGLDRVLKKERDFVREQGKSVDVTLYEPLEGKKLYTGVLAGYDGKTLKIGETLELPAEKVAQVRLHIDI